MATVTWFISRTLYNGGHTDMEDIMNCDEKKMIITFSLNNGYVSDLLNDANNMMSTISHEYDHPNYTNIDPNIEHLYIYYNQMRHSSYKNTTQKYKNAMSDNVKEIVNDMFKFTKQPAFNKWTLEQQTEFKKQYNRVYVN